MDNLMDLIFGIACNNHDADLIGRDQVDDYTIDTRSSLYLFLAVLFRRMGGFYYHWQYSHRWSKYFVPDNLVYQRYDSPLRRYARLDWQLFQDQ